MPESSIHQVFFTAEGLPADAARVRKLHAKEGVSRVDAIVVEIELPVTEVDPAQWLGRNAMAYVARADGEVLRRFAGLVTRVREDAAAVDPQRVTLTLESPMAALRWRTNCRIFQEQSSDEIVRALLDEHGLDKIEWRLQGRYPKREVCTQYGEDSLGFVSRVLEEDGIFYFVEHTEDGPTLVLGDSSAAWAATTPSAELPFRQASGLASEGAILEMTLFERVRPAKVTLRDHDWKRPSLSLEATASGDAPLGREHYDYPGRYVDPAEGQRRAQLALDALGAEAIGARGSSSVFSLAPGCSFTLVDAPDAELEREWMVREVEHVWDDTPSSSTSYSNTFTAVAKDAPFRPAATAPRARVPGPQIARVTGPPGEEIHTDSFGRVKVQFPWDRAGKGDDKSSCWVRVSQMCSSGSVVIPRVGWEVIVDFEDGDPDRPIVLGRVYNAKDGPPYALPANKTQSSLQSFSSPGGGGFNEIRMEDAGGSEQVRIYAQKDQNVVVANNKTEKVTTNATLAVGSNHTATIGANSTLDVGATLDLKVGGSQTIAIGASRTETTSGDEKIDVKGSRTKTIGGSHTTMTPMAWSASTPASYTETVGGSGVEAAALATNLAVAGTASFTVGGAEVSACATGASAFTLGARANTVGGAFISASGANVGFTVGGAKATTVGGAWAANAGGDVNVSSGSTLRITVGGALAWSGASVIFKVGGSNVTISGGSVVIKSSTIKLTATGPQPELAPLVSDK